jgi:[ribosomal protein S5]-alanine N-acetyltransferase
MAAMWTCPACGRRFAARNQTHACGRLDLRRHVEGRAPAVVATFERFREEVLRCGPAAVVPERTRVAFQTRMSFAVVSLRSRWLDGHVVLSKRLRSKRFRDIQTISPRNVVHAFRLEGPDEVDDEVSAWIAQAYLVGLQRHLPHRDPPPIRSARLDLVVIGPEAMVAMRRADFDAAARWLGCPIPRDWQGASWDWFHYRLADYADDPASLPWLARALVRRGARPAIVGNAGFHGLPDSDGVAEIGYEVIPSQRRKGFASEAAVGLMDWAATKHGIRRFRASVGPWNTPSLGLVRGLGFKRVGVQIDEVDGKELVFELSRPTDF